MTDPASEQSTVSGMSDEDIVNTFNALVESWEEREEARHDRDNFKREAQEPTLPANIFGDVEELVIYNRQRWQYEQELKDLTARHEEKISEFNVLAQKVKLLLPANRTLAHTYGGDNPNLQGARYSIRHHGEQRIEPSEVKVEKTGGQRRSAH